MKCRAIIPDFGRWNLRRVVLVHSGSHPCPWEAQEGQPFCKTHGKMDLENLIGPDGTVVDPNTRRELRMIGAQVGRRPGR